MFTTRSQAACSAPQAKPGEASLFTARTETATAMAKKHFFPTIWRISHQPRVSEGDTKSRVPEAASDIVSFSVSNLG